MSNTATHRHPVSELLARYAATFKAAWAARNELAGPKRLADETAFLPAALSLQATPPHPAPRRIGLAICALFVIALAWSILGQVDIVAVAPGRIVVSERTKTVQPLETSVVKRVLVRDGDTVRAGQVLVELDATAATADATTVQEQLAAITSEQNRTAALLRTLRAGHGTLVINDGDAPSERAQLRAEWADISAKLAKLDAERARRTAEVVTVQQLMGKLEITIPLARQRETDYKGLADQGFMAGHAGQDRTRERIEMERDLATQHARLAEARAGLREVQEGRSAFLADAERQLTDRHAQAMSKRQQLTQERNKTEQRARLTQLTAPVAGTVQQVAVHTAGGVVTPAQVLMIVVPKDAEVTAEVVIENRDIGFVSAGQAAAIKLETFPFTRYGTVNAEVKSVTGDAVNDEKRGAVFPATLTFRRGSIYADGKQIALSPGMNLTAEIVTGRRRIIGYLLAPVQQATSEGVRER